MMEHRSRRPVLAVVGSAGTLPYDVVAEAELLGKLAVDAGFRIASGGRDGVMEAVSRGARDSEKYREGDVMALLPSYRHSDANDYVDIAVVTGSGVSRNVMLVATGDVVVAVRGGSGTLSEISLAWQLGRPIVALASSGGWAQKLAGTALDARRDDVIVRADNPAQAVAAAKRLVSQAPGVDLAAALDPA